MLVQLQRDAGNAAVAQLIDAVPSPDDASVQRLVAPPAVPVGHVTVREGDEGAAVSALQGKLTVAGADPAVPVTGAFDAATKAAVLQFQRARRLVADGVVGAKTWAALDAGSGGAALDEADAQTFLDRKEAADNLGRAGKIAEAEVIYRELYAQQGVAASFRVPVTFSLGTCAHSLGRYEEAIGWYQEARDLPGVDAPSRLRMAQRVREARLRQPPSPVVA